MGVAAAGAAILILRAQQPSLKQTFPSPPAKPSLSVESVAVASARSPTQSSVDASVSAPPPSGDSEALANASIIQNHIYKQESATGKVSCAAYRMDEELRRSGFDPARYPWRMVQQRAAAGTANPELLYGTAVAQKTIWEHQHPENCGKASFLMYHFQEAGIGSQMHWLGQALAIAMNLGRVLVLAPNDKQVKLFDSSFCPGATGYQCWLQAITSCPVGSNVMHLRETPAMDREPRENFRTQSVPLVFHDMLANCSPIKTKFWFYWWRAQSVTYLIRFNSKTREALNAVRSESLLTCGARMPSAAVLAPGHISAHVRLGEKGWREAEVFQFETYMQRMEELANGSTHLRVLHKPAAESDSHFSFPASAYAGRRIFLSTEDEGTVQSAMRLCSSQPPWEVTWTKAQRYTNVDPWTKIRKGSDARREILNSFVNLELALEADAWVCTLSSNWCRLIDELRMTVGMKASHPYLSLSKLGIRRRVCPEDEPQCYLCH